MTTTPPDPGPPQHPATTARTVALAELAELARVATEAGTDWSTARPEHERAQELIDHLRCLPAQRHPVGEPVALVLDPTRHMFVAGQHDQTCECCHGHIVELARTSGGQVVGTQESWNLRPMRSGGD